jgi:hypothetical protein
MEVILFTAYLRLSKQWCAIQGLRILPRKVLFILQSWPMLSFIGDKSKNATGTSWYCNGNATSTRLRFCLPKLKELFWRV